MYSTVFNSIEVCVKLWYQKVIIGFGILKDISVGGITECMFKNLDKNYCWEHCSSDVKWGIVMASPAPSALFTHCCAYKLNLVLLQSAKLIRECRSFS